jgi:hypothetical protein
MAIDHVNAERLEKPRTSRVLAASIHAGGNGNRQKRIVSYPVRAPDTALCVKSPR